MYMGVGGRGVNDMPSSMYIAQVDCVGCHFIPKTTDRASVFSGKTYGPTKQGCVQCHGEDYLAIFDMWQESLKSSLDETGQKLLQAKTFLESNPGKATREKWEALNEAEYNYEFVKESHGIHNPDYAGALLKYATEKLEEILK